MPVPPRRRARGGRNDAAVTPKKEGSPVRASSGLPCFFESVHCKSNLRGGNTPSGHTRAEKPHSPAKRQAWSATQSVSTEKGPLRIATTGREGLFPPGKGEVPLERRDCPRPGNHGKARWGLLTLFAVCWGEVRDTRRAHPQRQAEHVQLLHYLLKLFAKIVLTGPTAGAAALPLRPSARPGVQARF